MEESKESVTTLINNNTKESMKDPNITANLQIAEKVKADRKVAKEAVGALKKIYKGQKMKRLYMANHMLEILSKNSSPEFHEYLSQEDFMQEFIKTFKIRRGKGGLFSKFETKAKKELREKVEDQGLYLLQLWADTFMMYQEMYPGFQKYYRQLKVEGMKFPERDLNERTMMDNLEGINSPMFDFIEQAKKQREESTGKERKSNFSNKKNTPEKVEGEGEDEPVQEADMQDTRELIKEAEEEMEELEEIEDYINKLPDDADRIQNANYSKYEKTIFDRSEFEIAKNNIEILDNMAANCENFSDMRTDVIADLFETALRSKLKIEKIVKVRKNANVEGERENELQEILHEVSSKLDNFKTKYDKLKAKEIRKVEKRIRKLNRQLRKENKLKRKQEKAAKERTSIEQNQKQKAEKNPFTGLDDTDNIIEDVGAGNNIGAAIEKRANSECSESEDPSNETSSMESSESESSIEGEEEGSDGLVEGIDFNEQYRRKRAKRMKKEEKRKHREKKKKQQEKENKSRDSKLSANKAKSGGILRNSVLVQKTLNFFSRK